MKQKPDSQRHFANEGEVAKADEALLESATGRSPERDPADVLPNTPRAEGAVDLDVSARPLSEVTSHIGPGNDEETVDGLSETEEALRRAAERG